jgi:hypothetical protein
VQQSAGADKIAAMTTTDAQFIERAQENIRELEEESRHLSSTIRGLEERRQSIALRIKAAQSALGYYSSLMGTNGFEAHGTAVVSGTATLNGTVTTSPTIPPRRRTSNAGPTVAEMCAEYMAAHGGEADVSDLASHLIEAGRYTPERRRQAYRLITAILLRDRRFRKVSPGRYGLADRPVAATTTGATDGLFSVAQGGG